jgi:hypothetical protein
MTSTAAIAQTTKLGSHNDREQPEPDEKISPRARRSASTTGALREAARRLPAKRWLSA